VSWRDKIRGQAERERSAVSRVGEIESRVRWTEEGLEKLDESLPSRKLIE
jgi:hypothetical protein